MKMLTSFLVILAFLLGAPGFANSEENWTERDVLIRKAQELSERMSVFTRNDTAVGMYFGGDPDIDEVIQSIVSYDYGQPTNALVFWFDDALVQKVVGQLITQGIDLPKEAWFPDALKTKVFNVLPALLNNTQGTSWLAACSILQMTDVFALEGAKGSAGYVILSYAGDQPSVVVSFCINDDSSVLAYGTYTRLPDDLKSDGKTLIDNVFSAFPTMPEEIHQALSEIHIDALSGKEFAKILE